MVYIMVEIAIVGSIIVIWYCRYSSNLVIERLLNSQEIHMACKCTKCFPYNVLNSESCRMILCPKCGNKRCPYAEWHGYECTDSNEPNQVGIVSADAIKLMNKVEVSDES
jgi:hypothetical protein